MFRRELDRGGVSPAAIDAGFAGVFGGLLGAKLWWTAEHLGTEPLLSLLLSRGGMSWFGGFTGGLAAGLLVVRVKRLPLLATLAAAAPALAIGHAIGRIGCFLVGDDYGKVSDLPWAVAFPEGLPPTLDRVHPTQIYEAIPLFVLGAVLLVWRRQRQGDRIVLGAYFTLAGTTRFLIEFVRVNERVLGSLTVAHLATLSAVAVGLLLLTKRQDTGRFSALPLLLSSLFANSAGPPPMKPIEFLTREGCVQTKIMGASWTRQSKAWGILRYTVVDLDATPSIDVRKADATPTVLDGGVDLSGMAEPKPSKHRVDRRADHRCGEYHDE